MLNFYHIVNQLQNLPAWVSMMRRNSLRIAPVSAILPINLTPRHLSDLSNTWSSTNTGAHSKWCQPVAKSSPPAILPDRFYVTEVSAFKSSPSDMLTLRLNSTRRLCYVRHDSKTPRIDRIA